MADTLLFRGGDSASIAVSNVQSREIVIDTDTDQIVSGTSKKKTVMEQSNGDVEIGGGNIDLKSNGSAEFAGSVSIGGTLPSAPNIELNADGSATYNSGQFNIATYKRTAAGGGVQISLENGNGTTRTLSNDSSGHLFFGYAGANQAALTNSGNFQVGGTLTSAPNITLNSNGSITAAGSVSIGGTAAANTIDEYEVGSYTPAFNAGTYTYNFQIGSYVKIGKLVTVIFDLQVSSVSSASTGSIQISLPFANNNVGGGAIMYPNGVLSVVSGLANSKIANSIQTQNNTALVNVKLLNGTGSNNVGQYQDLQANSRISGSITYTTSG